MERAQSSTFGGIYIQEIIKMLSYPFILKALIAGVFISLCAALLGVILVLKRYSMIGHGLGDVGFASLSFAVALGLPPMLVSMPIVIVAAFIIMLIGQKNSNHGDVAIGIVATSSLSVGVIITALTKGFNIDVTNYMFGSILAMSDQDVFISAGLSVIVILLFVLLFNRLFMITFDENFARTSGINVTFYQFVIALLTAVTVVVGMRMMGTLLISSLIIFPAMIAKRLVSSFRGVVVISAISAVVCFIVGVFLSFILDLPTGASVVMVNLCVLALSMLFSKIKRSGLSKSKTFSK